MTEFSLKAIRIIKSIPLGLVMTYGQVAKTAGSPRGARQIARLLHSSASKYQLPWHRIVGAGGQISLPWGSGKEEQIAMLLSEGVECSYDGKIDLSIYQWEPEFQ